MSDSFTAEDFYAVDGGETQIETDSAVEADIEPEGVSPAADEADGQAEPEAQPEKTYLDFNALEGQFARLKVGDEEIEVPATELPQWAMRQADYTRKTQELAQERENLRYWQTVEAAFQQDPAATLAHLAKQFGVDALAPQAEVEDDDDQWVDPVEKAMQERFGAFEKQLAPIMEHVSRQQAIEAVDTVVKGMQAKYGEEFDVKEVLEECQRRGIEDPSLIEAVHRDMAADRFFAHQAAQRTATSQRQQEDATKRAAAQGAAAATGASGGAAGGRSQVPAVEANSPKEAFAMAMRELREQGVIT